jgi:hypothetical protein
MGHGFISWPRRLCLPHGAFLCAPLPGAELPHAQISPLLLQLALSSSSSSPWPGPSLASAPTSPAAPSRGPSHVHSPSPISHGRTAPLSRARPLTGRFPSRELWRRLPLRARLWSSPDPKLRSPVAVELAQVRSSSTFGLCSSQPMPISLQLQAELVSTTPAASRRPWCFPWRPSGYASLCLWSCSLSNAITSPTATLSPFFKSPSPLLGPLATTVVERCSTSSMHEQQQPRASSASCHRPARWNAAASSTRSAMPAHHRRNPCNRVDSQQHVVDLESLALWSTMPSIDVVPCASLAQQKPHS